MMRQVWFGQEGSGRVRLGLARHGKVRQEWQGASRLGQERRGKVWQERLGWVRYVPSW